MDNQMIGNILLEKLKPGDHIASGRSGDLYEHHGIYIGKDNNGVHKVTHFKGPIKDWIISCSMQSTTHKCSVCDFKPLKNGGRFTTCLDCFRRGSTVRIVKYQTPYPNTKSDIFSHDSDTIESKYVLRRTPEEIIKAALSNRHIGKYSLMFNNCEDFAVYCTTGKERSAQSEHILHKAPYKIGKVVHLMSDLHKMKEKGKEKAKEMVRWRRN